MIYMILTVNYLLTDTFMQMNISYFGIKLNIFLVSFYFHPLCSFTEENISNSSHSSSKKFIVARAPSFRISLFKRAYSDYSAVGWISALEEFLFYLYFRLYDTLSILTGAMERTCSLARSGSNPYNHVNVNYRRIPNWCFRFWWVGKHSLNGELPRSGRIIIQCLSY